MDTILISTEFLHTLIRFVVCFVFNGIIVNQLYYKKSKRRDFYFTFMVMSVAIFFLVYFMMGMERAKATMGVGLGLFGIFSIMRYRTDSMPVREMTYLFVIICMSVVHAMADDYVELVIVDVVTFCTILLCELKLKVMQTKLIQYDRIELIKPERRAELKADLEARTGLKIIKVEVGGVDFLRDSAVLRIIYEGDKSSAVNGLYEVKKSQWREM